MSVVVRIRKPQVAGRVRHRIPMRIEQSVFRTIVEMAYEMSHAERGYTFIRWMKEIINPIFRLPSLDNGYDPYYGVRFHARLDKLGSLKHEIEEGFLNGYTDQVELRRDYYEVMTNTRLETIKKQLVKKVAQFKKNHSTLYDYMYSSS